MFHVVDVVNVVDVVDVLFHVANLVPGYLRCRGSVYLEYTTRQLEENTVFNIQSLQN